MYTLSENSGWWKGLSTSHDERIMTAIARQSKSKGANSMANATRNFVNWLAPTLAITFRESRECVMMTERTDAYSGPRLCWYIELFEFFVDPSAI